MNDDSDFTAYVVARSPALLRRAYVLTGDLASAEDLLQISLAKAWGGWDRIEPGRHDAYVAKVLVTTNISIWRRHKDRSVSVAEVPESPGPRAPTPQVEDRLDLWEQLRTLSPRLRTVVVLRYYDDLTEAQTAAAMGISVGAVKRYHHRAMEQLRRSLTTAASPEGALAIPVGRDAR